MKLYILADLEGATGVTGGWKETNPDGREFAHAKAMLTGDINACARGAFDAGVREIVCFDGHGMALSVDPVALDSRVSLIQGHCYGAAGLVPGLDKSFDAMVILGMHAMEGTADGIMNSTWWSPARFWLNGKEVGETGLFASMAAQLGVPTIMVSGDEAVSREATDFLPGVYTVAVKKGLCRYGGQIVEPTKAWSMIEETTKMAVKGYRSVAIQRPATPVEVKLEYQGNTQVVDGLARLPGVERINGYTVCCRSDSVEEAMALLTSFTTFSLT
jgi:D-amino peptidase